MTKTNHFKKISGLFDALGKKLNPGVLLLIVALLTMAIANSPLSSWYLSLWNIDFYLGSGHFNFLSHHGQPLTLLQLVNDAIMAIFFFTVGLEIKREMLVGELSSFRKAILPVIAACGGMILPVAVFFLIGTVEGFSDEQFKGIAIPMATDIAFSLGVLALLGKKVPSGLKIFLLALAIADDIGGIIVIALFYSHFTAASLIYLSVSFFLFIVLILGNRFNIHSKLFYAGIGVVIWYLFLQSGIHPTVAGVLVAFTVPARPRIDLKKYISGIEKTLSALEKTIDDNDMANGILSNKQIEQLNILESASDHVISPLQDFEDNLNGFVNYFIMPLFAFANAGVILSGSRFTIFSGITFAVVMGLFIGKSVGIFSFTWLAVKTKISVLPSGSKWLDLFGIATLGGIGFTVALFLAGLSYPVGSEYLNDAKLGIIAGSLIAGITGFFILRTALNRKKK